MLRLAAKAVVPAPVFAPVLALALAGCSGEADGNRVTAGDARPFDGIAADETFHFSGTEPFWGGQVVGETLTYTVPDDIEGQQITVKRFAGLNGLGFSGELGGQNFDMAVTQGDCSDGMSDRTYPFTVTLRLGDGVRNGCGYTGTQPFTGTGSP